MLICSFLFVELTNLSPWIDSKLHEEVEPSVFYSMAVSSAISSVGWLNLSLVITVEGLGSYILGTEKGPPGEITWPGWWIWGWAQYL